MRQPRIAGVGGGVGTTTITHALWAFDADLYSAGEPVDVLVCRTTTLSLGDALGAVGAAPAPPVLAVVADLPAGARVPLLTGPVKARLRMVEPHVAALVAVPFVTEWRGDDDPYSKAAHVLRVGAALPRHLREFAAAMAELTGAVNALLQDSPPGAGVPATRARPVKPIPALFDHPHTA